MIKRGEGVSIPHSPNQGQISHTTRPGVHLIAVPLQGKLAGLRGCRIGIACPKETPDCRFLVGEIWDGGTSPSPRRIMREMASFEEAGVSNKD